MDPRDRLHKALQKITRARASIVQTAARWQAGGVETSPLAEPLVEIQEAVTQLETLLASMPKGGVAPYIQIADKPGETPSGT